MEQRFQFVMRCRSEATTMAELCRQFEISRETGYKWLHRYERLGVEGLAERGRVPRTHPNATPDDVLDALRALRGEFPTYGPKKLVALLGKRRPEVIVPSPSTVGAFLHREGLVVPHRRVRHARAGASAPPDAADCNETWATDFKGQFLVANGRECFPLTISDQATRFLLRCTGLLHPRFELAQPPFEATLRAHGLPRRIRSDNGSPFASTGFSGLTRLSAWWVKLGIEVERSRPGCPQDNGRLERLHRTLKAETTRPPAATMAAQQRVFDAFRTRYNEERPHEALGQQTPASLYTPSPRPFPSRMPLPQYPGHMAVRRLAGNGVARWRGFQLPISQSLGSETIAFDEVGDGLFAIHFYRMVLGEFDERTGWMTAPKYKRRFTK